MTTAYLLIHPTGSSTQSICSYIKNITKDSQLQEQHLNDILQKYNNIFETTKPLNEITDQQTVIWKSSALTAPSNS